MLLLLFFGGPLSIFLYRLGSSGNSDLGDTFRLVFYLSSTFEMNPLHSL